MSRVDQPCLNFSEICFSTDFLEIKIINRLNDIRVRLLVLWVSSRGYVLIKGAMFIEFWIFVPFFVFFPLAMYKKSNYLFFEGGGYVYSRGYVYFLGQMFQGLCLFKGLRLF